MCSGGFDCCWMKESGDNVCCDVEEELRKFDQRTGLDDQRTDLMIKEQDLRNVVRTSVRGSFCSLSKNANMGVTCGRSTLN